MAQCFLEEWALFVLAQKYELKLSSIRSAASRAGLTSRVSSLNHFFSMKEEEALVEICRRQARQFRPFTIPVFCKVARNSLVLSKDPEFWAENSLLAL